MYLMRSCIFCLFVLASPCLGYAQDIVRTTTFQNQFVLRFDYIAKNNYRLLACEWKQTQQENYFWECNVDRYNKLLQNNTLAVNRLVPSSWDFTIHKLADRYYAFDNISAFNVVTSLLPTIYKYDAALNPLDSFVLDSSIWPARWLFNHNRVLSPYSQLHTFGENWLCFISIDSNKTVWLNKIDTTFSTCQFAQVAIDTTNLDGVYACYTSANGNIRFTASYEIENDLDRFMLLYEIKQDSVVLIDTVGGEFFATFILSTHVPEIEIQNVKIGERIRDGSGVGIIYGSTLVKYDAARNILAQRNFGEIHLTLLGATNSGLHLIKKHNAYYFAYSKYIDPDVPINQLQLSTHLVKLDTNLNVLWEREVLPIGRNSVEGVAMADCDLIAVFTNTGPNTIQIDLVRDRDVIGECTKCNASLWPNPTYGSDITLKSQDNDVLILNSTYYDNAGRLVWKSTADFAESTLIDHPNLAQGIYHVFVQCDNDKYSRTKVLITE